MLCLEHDGEREWIDVFMPAVRLTFGSVFMAYGMPVMMTARPARSEKSRPSLTLPLHATGCLSPCNCAVGNFYAT